MKLVMKESKDWNPVKVRDDVYPAVLKSIQERTDIAEDGRTLVELSFELQTTEKTILTGLASATLSTKSKLRKWVEAIRGSELKIGEEVDVDTCIGKSCRVVTATNTRGNSTISNVLPA